MKLTLRQQPTPITCMATSLAMILDMDTQECIDKYHDELYSCRLWYDEVFDEHKIEYEYGHPKRNYLKTGRVYIVTVQSLNTPNSGHAVVVDMRSKEMKVLDPCKGIEGKRFYGEGGEPLGFFSVQFSVDGKLYEGE